MGYKESKYTINSLTKVLFSITAISILLEIIIFPSLANMFGCMMMAVSCIAFTKLCLKIDYIINAPFSFFMMCSMFLFHYLPVPATMLSLRPVSYGMEFPIETFLLETFMFLLGCMAFLITAPKARRNGLLKSFLAQIGFYDTFSERAIWILGFLGFGIRVFSLMRGRAETGDIIGKMMNVLFYYMYIPVILLFPGLYNKKCDKPIDFKRTAVWGYLALATIISLATNSRNKIIAPFCILLLLLFLTMIKCNFPIRKMFTFRKAIITIVIFFILMSGFDAISQAMMLNRSIRSNLNFTELLSVTAKTIFAEDRDEKWKDYIQNIDTGVGAYSKMWTEEYVSNTWLNRFCNIRITDETLYLAKKLGTEGKQKMFYDFNMRVLAVLPQPFLKVIAPTFNKELYYNARGDALYIYAGIGQSTNWGEFRVTSNLGDGLATFGLLYYPLQILSWIIIMSLLNSFARTVNGESRYSLYGLLASYSSFMKFVNGNGILDDLLYMVRGYWQEIILFMALFTVARTLARCKIIGR